MECSNRYIIFRLPSGSSPHLEASCNFFGCVPIFSFLKWDLLSCSIFVFIFISSSNRSVPSTFLLVFQSVRPATCSSLTFCSDYINFMSFRDSFTNRFQFLLVVSFLLFLFFWEVCHFSYLSLSVPNSLLHSLTL